MVIFFLPALAYMGLIFYLSASLPPPILQGWPDWHDINILHIGEYGGLATLMMYGFLRGTRIPIHRVWVYVILASILYGISDEWHQSFVPQRVPSVGDVIADAIGAILAVSVYTLLLRWPHLPRWLCRQTEQNESSSASLA